MCKYSAPKTVTSLLRKWCNARNPYIYTHIHTYIYSMCKYSAPKTVTSLLRKWCNARTPAIPAQSARSKCTRVLCQQMY